MKTCPYCGAALEDEAKYCLYCMRELEPKATVKPRIFPRRRVWLAGGGALLVLLFGVGLTVLLPRERGAGSLPQGATGSVGESVSDDPAADLFFGSSSAGVPSDATAQNLQTSQNPAGGGNASTASGSAQTPGAAANGDTTSRGGTTTQSGGKPASEPQSGGQTTSVASAASTPTGSTAGSSSAPAAQISYRYRDAVAADLFAAADVAQALARGAVAITGVETPAENGVYVIPARIDGKPVVAVMDDAFSDPAICGTVKKIVFPASLHSMREWFLSCGALTDLYFSGESVALSFYTLYLKPGGARPTVHGKADAVCTVESRGQLSSSTLRAWAASHGLPFSEWDAATGD